MTIHTILGIAIGVPFGWALCCIFAISHRADMQEEHRKAPGIICEDNRVWSIAKASKKLAYIHERIDLYDDRPDLHDEEYWLTYLTDPEWGDSDIEWEWKEE